MSPHVFPKSLLELAFECEASLPLSLAGFTQISTDSRSIQSGELFVALPGDSFDGHAYIEAAFQKGASAALATRAKVPETLAKKYPIYLVPDSLTAFRNLAKVWRSQFTFPVIAIGGCVGKTTTKEMLASLLSGHYPNILKTELSQNGFAGIPMTLMKLRSHHHAAVIEIGIDDIGAMESHLEIVKPTHGIVTAIGPEHLELLKDVETVFREEMKLAEWIRLSEGTIALNADDTWIQKSLSAYPTAWTYSLGKNTARVVGKNENDTLKVNQKLSLQLPLKGDHNAQNLLAASTIALSLGMNEKEILTGLQSFQTAKGRSEWKKINELMIFADYYNASPVSMRASFSVVKNEAQGKPLILCLGDMLELGTDEEKYHRDLRDDVLALKPKSVFLYGPRMKWLNEELQGKVPSQHYSTHEEMAKAVMPFAKTPTLLLLKGSRGMRMENVLKALETHGPSSTQS